MKTGLTDTHPDAERVQLELLRAASPARRFAIMSSLSWTLIEASRRAILERRGDGNELEAKLEWVRLHYGADLERRLRADLERRGRLAKPEP